MATPPAGDEADDLGTADPEEAVIEDAPPPTSDEDFAEGARNGRGPNETSTPLEGQGGFRRVPDEEIWKHINPPR